MDSKIRLLRISFWTGAIIDGLMVIPMLFPQAAALLFGISDFRPGPDYRYAMGVGASLMAGWTLLLIWADRNPVERRGVLLITVLVLLALATAGIYAVLSGFRSAEQMIHMWALQIVLVILFSYSYLKSGSND